MKWFGKRRAYGGMLGVAAAVFVVAAGGGVCGRPLPPPIAEAYAFQRARGAPRTMCRPTTFCTQHAPSFLRSPGALLLLAAKEDDEASKAGEGLNAAAKMGVGQWSEEKRVRLPRGVRKYIRRLKMEGKVIEAEKFYEIEMEKAQRKRAGKQLKGEGVAYGSRYVSKKRKGRLTGAK